MLEWHLDALGYTVCLLLSATESAPHNTLDMLSAENFAHFTYGQGLLVGLTDNVVG